MVRVNIGDYVVYTAYRRHRCRGVVTMICAGPTRRYYIRRLAVCVNRVWHDNPLAFPSVFSNSAIKFILPQHIAMQYRLKGL